MRLLITTQIVDKNDPYLGFFHTWLEEFAKHFESITVICLKEGLHDLPANVRVYSLGKENGRSSRLVYALRFLKYIWKLRKEYDAAFVHMNEEYVLLGGRLWKRWGKKVYLWRNHYEGSRRTDRAAALCDKVFCTSKYSYTAKYPKTVLMPVGVDTNAYRRISDVSRDPRGVLFYARMAPSKKPDVLLEALGILHDRNISFAASFYGTALPKDEPYLAKLKERANELGMRDVVHFYPGTAPEDGPPIYNAHAVYADLGASGMYNKMLFEAAACECLVLTASKDFAELVDPKFIYNETGPKELADKLEALLNLPMLERQGAGSQLHAIAVKNSLETLGVRLKKEIGN